MLQDLRKAATIPCTTLLRNKIIIPNGSSLDVLQIISTNDMIESISLDDCRKAATSEHTTARYSHAAQLVLDASRYISEGSSTIKWTDLDWDLCSSPLQLPCLQNKVFRMSFCTPMSQKSNIIYLLSKTILQRCMTRKFNVVCLRAFNESKNTCDIVKQIVLISLLGNYEHSLPKNRPQGAVRAFLYDVLFDDKDNINNNEWFLQLVENCPYLIEFCLRDFVSFHLKDDPSYERHVGGLLNVQNFHYVLSVTMDLIRKRFTTLKEVDTPLSQICIELSHTLQLPHTALLSLSYRLPKTMHDILSALTSARGESNQDYVLQRCMVPIIRPKIKEEDEIELELEELNMDSSEDQEFALAQEALASLNMVNNLSECVREGIENNKKETEEAKGKQQQWSVLSYAKELVGEEIYARLHEWVSKIAPTRRDSLFLLITLFPLLGVKIESAQKLYFVINEYRNGSFNHLTLPAHLLEVQKMDELCYNVLQIVVDLMKVYIRVTIVRKLPAHYIIGQMKAAQSVFKETIESPHAVYDSFDFLWCSVCNSLYSMVREYKASFLKTYRHGYRDAIATYKDDHLYCWRNKTNVIGSCKLIPLIRFSLFGLVYHIDGKDVLACGTCCCPQVADVDLCYYNENGMMCAKCAESAGTLEIIEEQRLQEIESKLRKCVICEVELKSAASSYYYHEDVYVCSRHQHKYVIKKIKEQMELDECNWPATHMRDTLIKLHRQSKIDLENKRKPLWKRELALSKLSRNAKR